MLTSAVDKNQSKWFSILFDKTIKTTISTSKLMVHFLSLKCPSPLLHGKIKWRNKNRSQVTHQTQVHYQFGSPD